MGDEFLAALRDRLEAISAFPESCPLVYRNVRRGVLRRFPYLVFYIVHPDEVTVVAVLHQARNPADWPPR